MTPQELKNSILQLAIQGKLVEQRPEEGTAQELYDRIQAEKRRLIKAGKIKKEKPLPEITEEEKPFEIPKGWMWVKFGNVVNITSARRVHQSDWKKEGIPFYRAREIAKLAANGTVKNELFISPELYADLAKSGIPQEGDLMVTAVGTLGKTYTVRRGDIFYYKDASVICLENYGHISSEYLKIIMQSELMMKQVRNNSSGTTVATLTMVRMIQYVFPLPPLAEQKRIVTKIEKLLPLIDRYEQAWTKLEDFNRRFPEEMKKSILQQAIQGKLVEQRPEEGTAQELYEQIQAEKRRLIKAGKIKKEKPLPEITEEEKSFEIPEGWRWVRLADLCKSISDGDHQPPPQVPNGVPFLVISNLSSGNLDFSNTRYVPREYFERLSSDRVAEKGDVLFTVTGSYGIPIKVDNTVQFCFQRHVALLKLLTGWDYLFYALKSPIVQSQCAIAATGTAQKTVGLKSLRSIHIPLPPLSEQKRIVARLEELLPLCDRLKGDCTQHIKR